jgi:hypothetical protein
MQDLLARQAEQLERIENMIKLDGLRQLAQTYSLDQIDKKDSKVVLATESVSVSSDKIRTEVMQANVLANDLIMSQDLQETHALKQQSNETAQVVKAIKDASKLAQISARAHSESLKKLQTTLAMKSNLQGIAEDSGKNPAVTNIFDKVRNTVQNVREYGQRAKASLSNSDGQLTARSAIKAPLKAIGAAISPKYAEQLDYIKNEKNLGSDLTDKELKSGYKENNQFQQRNDRNEKNLERNRGTLTKEEYLKGGSEKAMAYQQEQLAVGEGLKKTDTRYRLDDAPKQDELAQYKAGERALGSRKQDKTLEKDFASRATLNDRNVANEATLATAVGKTNLTQEEFLTGNSKEAKEYRKEQASVGKGLEKVDSRHTIGEKAKPTKSTKATGSLNGAVGSMAGSIKTMTGANLAEDKIESDRTSEKSGITEERSDAAQIKVLNGQLKTQKEILVAIKEMPAPSSGTGLGIPATGGLMQKAGGMLQKAGGIASKVAGAAAIPLAVGVAGAAALNLAANTFSDSFGEGGFDVVKKLQDDKIIDYNATIAGFNPSEVLDWEGIQKLKPEEMKKLLESGVEFSADDTSKLNKIYLQSAITGGKEAGVAPVAPTAITPTAVAPVAANAVYTQSAETAQSAIAPVAPLTNNISSPTSVVNNSSSQALMRMDVKNPESSVQNMFSSRLKFR